MLRNYWSVPARSTTGRGMYSSSLHIEDAIEVGAIILECDQRSQLQQLFSKKDCAGVRTNLRGGYLVGLRDLCMSFLQKLAR